MLPSLQWRPFTHPACPAAASIGVADSFAMAEAPWRRLMASGHATPYQGFDWVRLAAKHLQPDAKPMIVLIADAAGEPLLLLPLGVSRHRGMAVAGFYGDRHLNYGGALFTDTIPADASFWRAIVAEIKAAGADLLILAQLPPTIGGAPNPLFALPGQPSPNAAYEAELAGSVEATLDARFSHKRLKAMRTKQRKLGELGIFASRQAGDEAERDAALAGFLAATAERFAERGTKNPFNAAAAAFMAELAACPPGNGWLPLGLFTLSIDDHIIAVLGATASPTQLSCSVVAYEAREPYAAQSPGQLIFRDAMTYAAARGCAVMDVGLGYAPYKSAFCNRVVEMRDVIVPLTLKGSLLAPLIRAKRSLKRTIKNSPRLWAAAQRLRRLKAGG